MFADPIIIQGFSTSEAYLDSLRLQDDINKPVKMCQNGMYATTTKSRVKNYSDREFRKVGSNRIRDPDLARGRGVFYH
jgi:hypothetical protein